ncbi:MAG: DUF3426 domain-containing protein [Pseudomonadota bacterium]|nr:DUF3426 domain-containing protein [Pseudomonadota bacterium]
MQTTCPECRTTFRVGQDDLGARRGLVRCGHCNAVFNAYDTLLPELEAPPADGLPESDIEYVEPAASEFVPLVSAEPEREARTPDAPRADDEAGVPAQTEDGTPSLTEPRVIAPAAASQATKQDILLEPLWAQPSRRQWSWKSVLAIFLAALLAGLLLLQAAYFLRAELAAAAPVTRPALELLCRPLNCVVPLPRQLTQEAITASSLEHDQEQKSRVRLTFLLTNRTGQTQAWPQITLTLSDVREAPVAQQVFRPQAYLPKGVKISAGMAAGGEREIRLDLDIGNLVASGYALRLAYP